MGMYGWHDNILDAQQIDFSGASPNVAAGPLILAGTSSQKITSSLADIKFIQAYLESSATSGDNRGMYLRTYYTGAGGGGDALRVYADVSVAAANVFGAHISLGLGESTVGGKVTGLGVGVRAQLGLPNVALASGGTYAALMAEIYSFGEHSDAGAVTELSFIRVVNDGHANGIADVDDDANLLVITGGAIASGNMVQAETDETKFSHKIRCKIHSSTMYLMACDS
jgi:hypothetical protein